MAWKIMTEQKQERSFELCTRIFLRIDTIYNRSRFSVPYLFILMKYGDHDSLTVSTLSMSFQHFSTIFLSTTAGWWGWGGCWWGWKASFIKPMRPAPLLGFPAINSGGGRAFAPGLSAVVCSPLLLRTYLSASAGACYHAEAVGEANKTRCVRW